MNRAAATLGIFASITAALPRSAQYPALEAVRTLRVSGAATGIAPELVHMRVADDGTIALLDIRGTSIVYLAKGLNKIQVVVAPDTGVRWPFKHVATAGWLRDSLYVVDRIAGEITVFSPNHGIASVVSIPRVISGPPGTKAARHLPPGLAPQVEAILSDGSLLVFPKENPTGPGSVKAPISMLRVTSYGEYIASLGPLHSGRTGCELHLKGLPNITWRPFCEQPTSVFAPNGSSRVDAHGVALTPDAGEITVTRTGTRGDTLYSKHFPFTPVKITRFEFDSALAPFFPSGRVVSLTQSGKAGLDSITKVFPFTYHQPLLNALVGNDGSVWLELSAKVEGHQWLILDSLGKAFGTTTIPRSVRLLEVTQRTAWGLETLSKSGYDLVRFQVSEQE